MKITLTRSMGAGGHCEWTIETSRVSNAERARWSAEISERLEMALVAIVEAPDEAESIARRALEEV